MDIDIDIPPGIDAIQLVNGIRASMVKDNDLIKHPVGVYIQNMPVDPSTNLAAIPYDVASDFGFFKFDFLPLHLLKDFSEKSQIRDAVTKTPNWDILRDPEVVSQLFHIGNHYDIIDRVRPTSISALADCLALIRPGKRKLLEQYIINPVSVDLYESSSNTGYTFKRSHAIAYASTIVLQMHALGSAKDVTDDDQVEW